MNWWKRFEIWLRHKRIEQRKRMRLKLLKKLGVHLTEKDMFGDELKESKE